MKRGKKVQEFGWTGWKCARNWGRMKKMSARHTDENYNCWNICDPAPLNEALWREYQKVKKVFHCNKHYFLHILMQKWLLCDIPIKSYKILNIAMYNIMQHNFTEIWAVKDLCLVWSVFRKNTSKMKKFWLGSYFSL